MLDRIQTLEQEARQLEPSTAQRDDWNDAVQAYANNFLHQIETLKAFVVSEDYGKDLLQLEIGETPRELPELLEALRENMDGIGLNPASGGHFGYVPGGGIFPAALGDYLAAVTNRYAGIFFGSPGAVRMENQLIRWMCDLIGYPEGSLGNLASGGSIANLIAITTARDFKGIKSRDVEKAVIYLTHQVHHCVQKALRIAGLREAQIHYVPMDETYHMDAEALRDLVERDKAAGLKPFLVVASAGTTDTGVVDPLDAIADVAETHDLWFHIDAAYGGFFMLVDEMKPIFKGIERSDSLAIDPHKGLFLPYGLGAILIKNVEATFDTHRYLANYMQDALKLADELSPADLSPELTKHFRGLRMWLPLQLFGLQPFRAALAEKVWLCRYFYERVQELGFEVGPYPDLSIMIYRYVPTTGDTNAFNEQLIEYVQQDGRVFLSSTLIDGTFWMRLAVLCFRSHLAQVDLCLEVLAAGVAYLQKKLTDKALSVR